MANSYYIDESGNSGDALNTGNNFDFCGQPVFSLACIGVDDPTKLDGFISHLKNKYRIQSPELKSTKIYKKKPEVFVDLVDFLGQEEISIFIELVDKKYFLSANLVNCHVMPPCFCPPETPESQLARNHCADFIYENAPASVFNRFIGACRSPSGESLSASFEEIRAFAKSFSSANGLSQFLLVNIDESIDDYEELKKTDGDTAYQKFIPIPDNNKKSQSIWMLPNLSSFTNLYARINNFHGGEISKIKMFHDEQDHFDEILQSNKELMEGLDMGGAVHFPTSRYDFSETAPLEFSKSHEHGSLQVADLLAGMTMRYLQEKIEEKKSSSVIVRAYNDILRSSNTSRGLGVNLVTTSKIHFDLHFSSATP
ncbi:MAG: DUF3800 domain-containing protein [Bacteroidota bacterium]